MIREMKWGDFVHTDHNGDEVCDMENCISLVDDYPGISMNSFTWERHVWEALAEHILSERDARKAEAAKQPKRWLVNLGGNAAKLAEYQGEGLSQDEVATGCDRDSLYVWAHSEKEAIHKAAEADHSLGVWVREYLTRDH
jgi:hypothetical protein